MFILYIEQGCPWGNKVMDFMDKNGIEAELRDRDTGNYEAELIARGIVVKVNRPAQGPWETFKLSSP